MSMGGQRLLTLYLYLKMTINQHDSLDGIRQPKYLKANIGTFPNSSDINVPVITTSKHNLTSHSKNKIPDTDKGKQQFIIALHLRCFLVGIGDGPLCDVFISAPEGDSAGHQRAVSMGSQQCIWLLSSICCVMILHLCSCRWQRLILLIQAVNIQPVALRHICVFSELEDTNLSRV